MPLDRSCEADYKEDYESLAHLYAIIHNNDVSDKGKAILKVLKNKNVNAVVPENEYFKKIQPKLGGTALHIALNKQDLDTFRLLLDCKVDFTIADKDGKTVVHRTLEENIANNRQCWQFNTSFYTCTPLYIATIGHQLDVVDLLIKRGANIFAKNADSPVLLEKWFVPDDARFRQDFLWEFVKQNKKFQKTLKKNYGIDKPSY